ncbi:MAG: NifB/NifX family molybdenum-iron cluster-binding protein [Candidatus Limnocylindrales bacterium]
MKIAIATDDGRTISQHFGRAAHYAVLTVENGTVVASEIRAKFSPHVSGPEAHEEHETGPHGIGPTSDARHDQMAAAIADCSAVICGGMGQGASGRMKANGIRPIVTDIRDFEEAAIQCATGRIVDHSERLH